MATLYASKGGSSSRSYADATVRDTPATIAQAYSLHLPGDRIEVITDGTPWTASADIPFNHLKAGLGPDARTTLAAADFGAFGKPAFQVPDGSLPVVWADRDYLRFENLDLSHGDAATKSSTGEAVVTTDSSTQARFVQLLGCRIGNTRNIAIQSKYGPTPHDASGHAGTAGLDDSDWEILGCEVYRANVHAIVCHGSRWRIGPWLNPLGQFVRGQIRWWGDSTADTGQAKHTIYDHSRGLRVWGQDIRNDQADRPWQGSISQRASSLEVFDCTWRDCTPLSTFWYDDQAGVTLIHDNKATNCYDWFWLFAAGDDTAPAYHWGPNPVDRYVFHHNVCHLRGYQDDTTPLEEAQALLNLADASAAFVGGLSVSSCYLHGNARRGVDFGARLQRFSANNGATGKYRGAGNRWRRDAGGILFRDAGVEYTLPAWQAR